MSDTPRTDAGACHVSVDRAGCILLWPSETGGYVKRKVSAQLERENAALRRDVYQCPPTSENGYEGLKWSDAFGVIEQDNAKLHNEVTALKHENLSLREARKPVAVPGLHGLVTWYADAQQLGEAFQREREKCIRFEEVMQSQGDEIRCLTGENDALREELKDAAMKGLGVALKAHAADLSDLQRENAALREKNAEWREMIREAVFDNNDILYWIRGARRILLSEVEKDHAARKKAQP